jgi:hypothetical protein
MNENKTKEWTGNQRSIYAMLGASNHADSERQQHDYYATEPRAVELLLAEEKFAPVIWEPACGEGHISKVLEQHGYDVISSDLIYRGYGDVEPCDFLKDTSIINGDIVTNPPYKYALEFVERALAAVSTGHKVAMLLRLQFLEGKTRKKFFLENPPKTVYVSASRLTCAINGDFDKCQSSAVAYAWFVWEKGFKGNPVIKWIN